MKRQRMSKSASRSNFRKGSTKIHRMNTRGAPMRGGIRL